MTVMRQMGSPHKKDDNDKIKQALLSADMAVFVTPIYYSGMSAQLKMNSGGKSNDVDRICRRFFFLCRDYGSPCQMWDTENRFECSYGDPYDRGAVVFVADGTGYRCLGKSRTDSCEDVMVSCFVWPRHRGVVALLFSCAEKRKRQSGCPD